jgi:hypothetical protein
METIQYSLKNSDYTELSIDLSCTINNSIEQKKFTNTNEKKNNYNKINTKIDYNNIFDKYCLDIYGKKTCIFFEISNDLFEMRFLDVTSKSFDNIKRSNFYINIPKLIEKAYTVVIVENIQITNTKEIVAIHSSPNAI